MTSLLAYHKQGPPRANDSKVSPPQKSITSKSENDWCIFFSKSEIGEFESWRNSPYAKKKTIKLMDNLVLTHSSFNTIINFNKVINEY